MASTPPTPDVLAPETEPHPRTVGLIGATGAGVGAIVGGGILLMAGEAYRAAGPAAVVAFALNGVIALLTAMSFAELSTAFPQSGGAYQFAKRAISVRAAFGMGWILWFAYIVAGTLYALGTGKYAVAVLQQSLGERAPGWLSGFAIPLGLLAVGVLTFMLMRRATGGGIEATIGKVIVFGLLVLAGVVAFLLQPLEQSRQNLQPFFPASGLGVLQAMGLTFITLQGFEVIAAVAGDVKKPRRTLPRAMFLSLGIALALYLPLLVVMAAAGVDPAMRAGGDAPIIKLAEQTREEVMAAGAVQFLGPRGYWLVIIAALLGTITALQAALLAGSRMAWAMAHDRALMRQLGTRHPEYRTPVVAVLASAVIVTGVVLLLKLGVILSPDTEIIQAAGGAASLVFLVSFALAHLVALLVRYRSPTRSDAWRAPFFPAVQVIGGTACLGLAIYQGIQVPVSGIVVLLWLAIGAVLYLRLFARRAEAIDAFALARDPELLRLRGLRPLVLTPIANPESAHALSALAHALAPPKIGRTLLLNVVRPPQSVQPTADGLVTPPPEGDTRVIRSHIGVAQAVLGEALTASLGQGRAPEVLMTVSDEPWEEISRVARLHACEVLLLGLSKAESESAANLEALLNAVDCDVVILRAERGWTPESTKRILVPIGGRSDHYRLRSRLLGSLCRTAPREVIFLNVLPLNTETPRLRTVRHELSLLAEEEVPGSARAEVVRADDPAAGMVDLALDADLVILGVHRGRTGHKSVSPVVQRIIKDVTCPVVLISSRG